MSTKLRIVCCATAVFLGLLFAYLFRFSITTGESTYKLDRWTGKIIYIVADQQLFVKDPVVPYYFLNEPKLPPSEGGLSPYSFLNKPTPKVASNPWAFLDEPPVVQNVSATEARKIGSSMMGGMAGLGLNPSAPETPTTPEELTDRKLDLSR